MLGFMKPQGEAPNTGIAAPKVMPAVISKQDRPSPMSPVIGVLGTKGGVGATTLSINLAVCAAAEQGISTLIDCNLQQPMTAVMLGQKPKHGLIEVIERIDELDGTVLGACAAPVDSHGKCRLLAPPASGEGALRINLSDLARAMPTIRRFSGVSILDLPRHLDRHLVTMLDQCDRILLCMEPTIPALAAFKQWINIFDDLGYHRGRIVPVLNRSGCKQKTIEQEISSMPDFSNQLHKIPNAYELAQECCIHGDPVVSAKPRSPYAIAVSQLAAVLTKEVV